MPTPPTNRRTAPLLLSALLALAGCAASVQTAPNPSSPVTLARVDRMVERERGRVRLVDGVSLPPLVPPTSLEPIDDEDTVARLTLDEAASRFPMPDLDTNERTPEDDPSRRSPALRSYLKGLHAIRAEDYEQAVERLSTATRLTPTDVEPWLALGDAYRKMGNQIAAAGAFRRVLELQPANPVALDVLSVQSLALNRPGEALPYLFALRAGIDRLDDPALALVVNDRLGRALGEFGYVNAAAEAFTAASSLPDRAPYAPAHQLEISALYRERGARSLRIGDALVRLGEPARALEWYERAAREDGTDQAGALARRLYTLLRVGRPASAIKALTEAILTERVAVDGQTSRLIEYVASALDDRGLLGRTLVESMTLLDAERAARLRPALLRASAVSMGADGATGYLLAQVKRDPRNEEARALLFELMDATPAAERAETLVSLIALAPETGRDVVAQASWLWDTLGEIASSVEIDENAPAPARDAHALTRGLLLSRNGEPAAAVEAWDDATYETETGRLARALRAQDLVRLDRWDDATAQLQSITDATGPWSQIEAANAWSMLERHEDAMASVQNAEILSQGNPIALSESFLARARVMARMGVSINVLLGVVQRAVDAAPGYVPPVTQLYAMSYRVQREDIEQFRARLLDSVQPLAEDHPLAVLDRAQELLRTGRGPTAYRLLRETVNQKAPDPGVDQLYFAIVNANALYQEGITWLRTRESQAPDESRYAMWIAELLSGMNKPESAAQTLEKWLERYPGDDEARTQLADLYREKLNDIPRSDALILPMIDKRPFSPDREVMRFQIVQRGGDLPAMTRILERLAPHYDALDPQQTAAIQASAFRLTSTAISSKFEPVDVYAFMSTLLAVDRSLQPQYRAYVAALAFDAQRPIDETLDLFFNSDVSSEQRDEALSAFMAIMFALPDITEAHLAFYDALPSRFDGFNATPYHQRLAVLWQSITGDGIGRATPIYDALGAKLRSTLATMDEAGLYEDAIAGATAALEAAYHAEIGLTTVAYTYALLLDTTGAPTDEVDRLYRYILTLKPDHADANNNLGYRILERGGDLQEAFELIKRAYDAEPASAHIVDSYGWALHKLGMDTQGPDGGPGAIEILEKAESIVRKQMQGFEKNAAGRLRPEEKAPIVEAIFYQRVTLVTVMSHLGDAYWGGGKREEAIKYWDASALLADTFGLMDHPFEIPEDVEADYALEADRCRAKVRAASEDRDPLALADPAPSTP